MADFKDDKAYFRLVERRKSGFMVGIPMTFTGDASDLDRIEMMAKAGTDAAVASPEPSMMALYLADFLTICQKYSISPKDLEAELRTFELPKRTT